MVFMTFTGSVPSTSSKRPAFGLTVKLRSFDIRPPAPVVVPDPEPEPTDPDPTPTDPEPEENPGVVINPENPTVTPTEPEEKPTDGEGTGTIIPDDLTETNQGGEPETVEEIEYVTVRRPTTIAEQSKEKPRKKQIGLSVLTGAIALGIITYILIETCGRCVRKNNEKKQIRAMQQMNTIVVGAGGASTPNQ